MVKDKKSGIMIGLMLVLVGLISAGCGYASKEVSALDTTTKEMQTTSPTSNVISPTMNVSPTPGVEVPPTTGTSTTNYPPAATPTPAETFIDVRSEGMAIAAAVQTEIGSIQAQIAAAVTTNGSVSPLILVRPYGGTATELVDISTVGGSLYVQEVLRAYNNVKDIGLTIIALQRTTDAGKVQVIRAVAAAVTGASPASVLLTDGTRVDLSVDAGCIYIKDMIRN